MSEVFIRAERGLFDVEALIAQPLAHHDGDDQLVGELLHGRGARAEFPHLGAERLHLGDGTFGDGRGLDAATSGGLRYAVRTLTSWAWASRSESTCFCTMLMTIDVGLVDSLNRHEGQPLRRQSREREGPDLPAEEAEVLRTARVAQRTEEGQLAWSTVQPGMQVTVTLSPVTALGKVNVRRTADTRAADSLPDGAGRTDWSRAA
ncbi:hypothetical protein [Streptomyces sp. NPDC096132]|uniref:hypothetical protein n=1 Tax=Streptomyces sp. NPDC096132 TaxID=3366075 RepID=UPI0037FAE24A